MTTIRGVHVGELRQAIDAVRKAAGLPAAWSSYGAQTGLIYASYFKELRDRLNEARLVFSLPDVAFSDRVAVGEAVRARTINELRDGVR